MVSRGGVKKILFVITKPNWGGAQRYVYDIVTSLPRDKFQAKVISGGEGELFKKLRKAEIETSYINELGRDIKILDDVKSFFALWTILKKEGPDILHLNSSKVGGLGALAGKLSGVPKIIFTAHGWAFNEERSFWSKLAIKFLSWFTIALSDKTIAVSESVLGEAPAYLLDKSKLELAHLGISPTKFLSRSEARTKLIPGARDDDFIIGSIAELHKNKGLHHAIEAIAAIKKDIPKIKYVILGEGEERARLERNIKKNSLENSVVLLGYKENASQYLKAFDILLAPSVTEALGYAVIEAGFAGVPVVGSSVGGIPEVINDMETGILVRPRAPKEVARAVLYLNGHKTAAKSLGNRLKNRVTEGFSIERMVGETVRIYES